MSLSWASSVAARLEAFHIENSCNAFPVCSSREIAISEVGVRLVGLPEAIRVDNGPEFVCHTLRRWCERKRVHLDFIQPGRPMQNGHVESFNGKFRDECLNTHWFTSLRQARSIIEHWRRDYNGMRPHSALGYATPNAFAQASSASSGVQSFDNTTARPGQGDWHKDFGTFQLVG